MQYVFLALTAAVQDDSKETHLFHHARNRKKTAEDVMHMVNGLRDEVHTFTAAQAMVEGKLAAVAADVERKFDSLFAMLNVECVVRNRAPVSAGTAPIRRPASASAKKS